MGSTLPPSPVAPFSPFFITSSRSSPRQLPTYLGNSATPPYTVVHLSFAHSVTRPLSLFLSLRAPPRWPLTPCNNARVYTVCPHPPAYIFASYNIDYFGRISGRAARELRPFLRLEPSHRASPRRAVPTTPRRTSHPVARVRPAFSQSLVVDAASTTLPLLLQSDVAMQTFRFCVRRFALDLSLSLHFATHSATIQCRDARRTVETSGTSV